jgi:hypothetical protein
MTSPTARKSKTIEERLASLEEELRDLEGVVDEREGGVHPEIRTKRLVIVDEDGFERLTAGAFSPDVFQVDVRCRDDDTFLRIQADNEADEDYHQVGVYLHAWGEPVARFEVGRDEVRLDLERIERGHHDTVELTRSGRSALHYGRPLPRRIT